jgi:ribosomal protein L12E/L44/L45/RPP1/RPP2
MAEEETRKAGRSHKAGIIAGVVVAALVVAGGGYATYAHVHGQQELTSQIREARNLVMFNPLANGPKAKKLKAVLPKVGENTTDKMLMSDLKGKDMAKLIADAKSEINAKSQSQLSKQSTNLSEAKTKLTKLESQKNFPSSSRDDVTALTKLADSFKASDDAVGMNVAVAGLQSLAGESTDYIQAKTKEQLAREKAKKEEAAKLAAAVKDETYPSLGMLRGDIANGGGVIPMFLIDDGPAAQNDFQTDSDWDDSSVIVAIDGQRVDASILGAHSMQKVLQTIPLGKHVTVKFKDGSSKKVALNLTQREAKGYKYPDLADPGTDTDSDINFGVDGYNIGQKHNNKEIGLVITKIDSDGSVANSDLKVGDIICKIGDYYVGNTTDIAKIMYNYYEDDEVTVDYVTPTGHLATTDVTLED